MIIVYGQSDHLIYLILQHMNSEIKSGWKMNPNWGHPCSISHIIHKITLLNLPFALSLKYSLTEMLPW